MDSNFFTDLAHTNVKMQNFEFDFKLVVGGRGRGACHLSYLWISLYWLFKVWNIMHGVELLKTTKKEYSKRLVCVFHAFYFLSKEKTCIDLKTIIIKYRIHKRIQILNITQFIKIWSVYESRFLVTDAICMQFPIYSVPKSNLPVN